MEIFQNGLRNQKDIIISRFLFSPQDLIYESLIINFTMTEKEAEDLCKMIRIGVDLSPKYNYHPETREELKNLIEELIEKRGNEADLNDVDVSRIEDMSELFNSSKFNGDISNWDVSRVENMSCMFQRSKFNGDISNWDVSSVWYMEGMLLNSKLNGDIISGWDVSKVKDINRIK